MTEDPRGSNVKRRRRRWRSMEEAYQAGQVVGFQAAIQLVEILNDPEDFIGIGESFSELIREAQRARGPGEIREVPE